MTLVLSVLEQGMIYAIMALGIYITYTILDFPDLTVDGSFPLGAALSAVLITKGVNPILTLLVTFAAGAFAGMLTGIIHVKLKVRDLLSGIIMMTALYTVNLRIAGRANLPIYNMTTLFDNDFVRNVFKGGLAQFSNVIIILVITLVMKFLLDWYMSTKSGYLLRAVGDNETIVTSMGRMPFSRFFSLMPATIEMANTAREKYSKEVNLRATDANRGEIKISTRILKKPPTNEDTIPTPRLFPPHHALPWDDHQTLWQWRTECRGY